MKVKDLVVNQDKRLRRREALRNLFKESSTEEANQIRTKMRRNKFNYILPRLDFLGWVPF